VHLFNAKGLQEKSVGGGKDLFGRVAGTDDKDVGLGAGAQFADQLCSARTRQLDIQQNRAGDALASRHHFQCRHAIDRGMHRVAAHGEHGG